VETSSARVCTVIVNWNGWRDTVECLESLLRSEAPPYPIVVCDNGSTDGSLERIREWAAGPAGIACVEVDRATAERGGSTETADRMEGDDVPEPDHVPLILVRCGANLGFAGASNVGLRFALARPDVTHCWLLNNDTVAATDALSRLLDESRRDPGLGMIGSTLLYHGSPNRVQTLGGGRYNRWLALPRHIGAGLPLEQAPALDEVRGVMDYVVGASMLVTRELLEDVGLLAEDYFLYFEELDWAWRARGWYGIGYAPRSIVHHKEGASIGGARDARNKSETADYHFIRNRILFTRRHAPMALPTVYLALLVAMARRILRGQPARAAMIARLCLTT
jgi:GT2 family glycosyltransferase